MHREHSFQVRNRARDQYSALIREARHEPTHRVGRELRDVRWNYTPRALYHELHCERADDETGEGRRERPDGNDENRQYERENDRPPPADPVRQVSECDSADNGADHRERGERRSLLRRETPIALEECRI